MIFVYRKKSPKFLKASISFASVLPHREKLEGRRQNCSKKCSFLLINVKKNRCHCTKVHAGKYTRCFKEINPRGKLSKIEKLSSSQLKARPCNMSGVRGDRSTILICGMHRVKLCHLSPECHTAYSLGRSNSRTGELAGGDVNWIDCIVQEYLFREKFCSSVSREGTTPSEVKWLSRYFSTTSGSLLLL